MLIYVAHPIDRANQHVQTKISGALASLGGGRAHLNGNHLYIPSAAFKLGPGCQPDTTINTINGIALSEAQAVLALWPSDAKSWGVPVEVDRAYQNRQRVALVVEDDPTWAMTYGDCVEVFKVDPREYDAFTMATLRAMDWLTGFERVEAPVYKPQVDGWARNTEKEPADIGEAVNQAAADRAQFERTHAGSAHVAISAQGIGKSIHPASRAYHDSIEVNYMNPAATGEAKETLTEPETDEKTDDSPECAEDPTEAPRNTIGFRDLQGDQFLDAHIALPTRGYHNDAGLDIYVSEDTIVEPHSFVDVRSHTAVNLPHNTWGYLVGRSSTLRKKGLLVNPGVIDNGYTGELYSAVWNLTSAPVKIHAGERVAQLILMPNITPGYDPEWVVSADESERGDKGFGSSGV